MNNKELAEIRRRFRPERSNICRVSGCLINEKKEIAGIFDQPLGELHPQLTEQLLPVLRRTLTGKLGRNLFDLAFTTRQVSEGEGQKLLERLRRTGLGDREALQALYDRIRTSFDWEGNYLILLTREEYDVPEHTASGHPGESVSTYTYLLCSVCPVRSAKLPTLGFALSENLLRCFTTDPCVAKPEVGFLYPSFEGRSANLYGALYYCRSLQSNHPEFTDAVFGVAPPPSVTAQKEAFHSVVAESAGEDCSYAVVEGAREQIAGMVESHKAERNPDPLYVTAPVLRDALCASGMDPLHGEEFVRRYDEAFGAGTELCPGNLLDPQRLILTTPDVSIRVSPDRGDLIETRRIDGVPCIVIRAEGEVRLNGVLLQIGDM